MSFLACGGGWYACRPLRGLASQTPVFRLLSRHTPPLAAERPCTQKKEAHARTYFHMPGVHVRKLPGAARNLC